MNSPLFSALSSKRIAARVAQCRKRVCYAAPGIQEDAAKALEALKAARPETEIAVSLDFNEQTLRMGYGSLAAVSILRAAGIEPTLSAGFRCAILIVDEEGWVFTPMALYLEIEVQSDETPNAIRLTADQVREVLLRLSPAARKQAAASAATPEEAEKLRSLPMEVGEVPLSDQHFEGVKKAIDNAPPVKFDVARQVRVFAPYLQYVELSLRGATIEKRKVRIPRSLQELGLVEGMEDKFTTTFNLFEVDSELSSVGLNEELDEIRRTFIRVLPGRQGSVVLKRSKPLLQERLDLLRARLAVFQQAVEARLDEMLERSKKQLVEYYMPLAEANPPELLKMSLFQIEYADIRKWVEGEIESAFPRAESIIQKMALEVIFKDVTFETLNRPEFLATVKEAFPNVDWDKPYNDFKAAGEAKDGQPRPSLSSGSEKK